MSHTYEVKLDAFEGPLDLLLHLVNKLEIDIYDIPVAEITQQYIDYIRAMERIELNIASEYLVMAATLLEIKSSMLLPKKEVTLEEENEEDPREQLIQRLIEYRKYKEAALQLQQKELEENQIYTRPPVKFDHLLEEAKSVSGNVSIYDMIKAVEKMLERKRWNQPLETTVHREDITIEERIDDILHIISQADKSVPFENLFPYPSKSYIVTTLLAILQLLKANKIECFQTDHFESIFVLRKGVS